MATGKEILIKQWNQIDKEWEKTNNLTKFLLLFFKIKRFYWMEKENYFINTFTRTHPNIFAPQLQCKIVNLNIFRFCFTVSVSVSGHQSYSATTFCCCLLVITIFHVSQRHQNFFLFSLFFFFFVFFFEQKFNDFLGSILANKTTKS